MKYRLFIFPCLNFSSINSYIVWENQKSEECIELLGFTQKGIGTLGANAGVLWCVREGAEPFICSSEEEQKEWATQIVRLLIEVLTHLTTSKHFFLLHLNKNDVNIQRRNIEINSGLCMHIFLFFYLKDFPLSIFISSLSFTWMAERKWRKHSIVMINACASSFEKEHVCQINTIIANEDWTDSVCKK